MTDFALSNPIGSTVENEDVRTTPRWLFDALNAAFDFALDAAASADNALCDRFIDEERNALTVDLVAESGGRNIFCNPPFSKLPEFARHLAKAGQSVYVAMICPANRVEQPWFQEVLETAALLIYPKGRVVYGGTGDSAPWPSMVVVWSPWHLGPAYAMTMKQFQYIEQPFIVGPRILPAEQAP